jgi:isoquinoline 1-oxidoreductase subunit alpha
MAWRVSFGPACCGRAVIIPQRAFSGSADLVNARVAIGGDDARRAIFSVYACPAPPSHATVAAMPLFSLHVNGQRRSVDVPADTPLLWVLRDQLELAGTKYGCGIGVCGACTIHANGAAVRACQMPVETAAAMQITTIEGLSPDASHPLQKAWCDHDVPQCGYCQPGQIMSAAALLKTNANPTPAQIDEALAGNLCRCGTYVRIRNAVRDAAAALREGGAK